MDVRDRRLTDRFGDELRGDELDRNCSVGLPFGAGRGLVEGQSRSRARDTSCTSRFERL
jgi:hypothetical protein